MHSKEYWINWGKRAGIRAARTIAQTAIASLGVTQALGDIDWMYVTSTAVLAGVISILTSIRGLPEIKIEEELVNIQNANQQDIIEENAEDLIKDVIEDETLEE